MTKDFFLGQIRMIAVAIIAYATGKGWLTSADSAFLGGIGTPILALSAPWLWSLYSNWNVKFVPHDAEVKAPKAAIAAIAGALALFSPHHSFAADMMPVKAPSSAYNANAQATCVAGNCSGGYVDFGIGFDAALAAAISNGGSNNGGALNIGGGYQFWQGQVITGIEANGGYQFGTAGSTGTLTGTVFGKLGYNFFPQAASAAPTPAQNPFAGFVPATLLQNSTPAVIAGGCYGHGVLKGCGGIEVDTVIAAGWSTAAQIYNAPSYQGQPDESVFRILVQRHF